MATIDSDIRKIQLKIGINPIRATLGDANGRIYDGDKYFIRWPASAGGSGFSYPSSVRLRPGISMRERPGIGVKIGIGDDDEYEIIGADYRSIVNSGDHPIRENPLSPYGNPQQAGVNQSDILTLKSHQKQIADLNVYVKAFVYRLNGTFYIWAGGTISLSSVVPGTVNYHSIALIVLKNDQTLGVYTSTAKDQGNPLTVTVDVQEAWTSAYAANKGNIPVWAYRMYYGQIAVAENDKYIDLREFINVVNLSPAITDFTNAQHSHQNTPSGSQLNASSVFNAGTTPLARGGTNADLSATGPGALVQATLGANVSLLAPGTARNVMISTGSAWESRALVVADIPSGIDHGGLDGLVDDDHTQYALLAGRSGGQTIKGGTASGDSLILSSTNHATKGDLTVAGFAVFKETPNQLVLTAGSKIMPASNTTTALNIANAAGTSFFIFDSTNLRARVQSGSDYIEFDPAGTTYQLTVFNSGVFDAKLGVSNSGWLTNTNVLVSGYAQASITSSGGTAITGVFKNSAASAANNAVAIVLLPYSSAGQSDGAQIRAFEANSTTGATDLIFMTDPASTGAVERLRISSIGVITQTVLDSATTSVTDILSLKHNSSGTPGAGYGSGLLLPGKSSTTDDRSMARIRTIWTTATDASRKARLIFSAYDTAERDVISIEASGSAGMLAFFGGTPVVKATALTAALTTLTFTAPGAPDYAIAAPIDSAVGSAFGFSTADEFNTHLSVIANLQVRVNEVESKLQAYSLIA